MNHSPSQPALDPASKTGEVGSTPTRVATFFTVVAMVPHIVAAIALAWAMIVAMWWACSPT